MKKLIVVLALLLIGSTMFAQNWVVVSNANLRESGSVSSPVRLLIPKGTLLDIAECNNGWCKTEVNNLKGFVRQGLVQKLPTVSEQKKVSATGPVKYYTNSQHEKVQSPTYYDKAPPGATARCKDGTYSFSRSRRGTCSHHGGVAEWL